MCNVEANENHHNSDICSFGQGGATCRNYKQLKLVDGKHTTIQIRVGGVGHNFLCNLALPDDLSICSVNSAAHIVKELGMK